MNCIYCSANLEHNFSSYCWKCGKPLPHEGRTMLGCDTKMDFYDVGKEYKIAEYRIKDFSAEITPVIIDGHILLCANKSLIFSSLSDFYAYDKVKPLWEVNVENIPYPAWAKGYLYWVEEGALRRVNIRTGQGTEDLLIDMRIKPCRGPLAFRKDKETWVIAYPLKGSVLIINTDRHNKIIDKKIHQLYEYEVSIRAPILWNNHIVFLSSHGDIHKYDIKKKIFLEGEKISDEKLPVSSPSLIDNILGVEIFSPSGLFLCLYNLKDDKKINTIPIDSETAIDKHTLLDSRRFYHPLIWEDKKYIVSSIDCSKLKVIEPSGTIRDLDISCKHWYSLIIKETIYNFSNSLFETFNLRENSREKDNCLLFSDIKEECTFPISYWRGWCVIPTGNHIYILRGENYD